MMNTTTTKIVRHRQVLWIFLPHLLKTFMETGFEEICFPVQDFDAEEREIVVEEQTLAAGV